MPHSDPHLALLNAAEADASDAELTIEESIEQHTKMAEWNEILAERAPAFLISAIANYRQVAFMHRATARRLSEMLEPSEGMVERAARCILGGSVFSEEDRLDMARRAAIKAAGRG